MRGHLLALTAAVAVFLAPKALATPSPSAPASCSDRGRCVDREAMREVMALMVSPEGPYSSAAAYGHFLRARLAHHQGDPKGAIAQLRLALATDEGHPYLRAELAEQHARLGEMAAADRILNKLLEEKPRYRPALTLHARVLLELDNAERAKARLKRAIAVAPEEPDAPLVLAHILLEQNDLDGAIRWVEAHARAAPHETYALKRMGLTLFERGESGRALPLLEAAALREPGDGETELMLAQIWEALERPDQAQGHYEIALARRADPRDALMGAGRVALRRGFTAEAMAYFDALLVQVDDTELILKVAFLLLSAERPLLAAQVLDNARRWIAQPRLSFYAGLVHERAGEYGEAASAFAEIPPSSELFSQARLHQGAALLFAGRVSEARVPLQAALEAEPADPTAQRLYARALELSGNASGAEVLLQKSLREQPTSEGYEALSELYQRQGRPSEAVALLNTAILERPRDEQLLFALGIALDRKGETEAAMRRMRELLAINPDHSAAMNFVGYSLAERGVRFDEAEKLLLRALELKPENGSYLDSLGWIYFRRGDFARAVGTLERAVQLAPYEPLIIEHLGDAYQGIARLAEAVKTYRRALESLARSPTREDLERRRHSLENKLKVLSSEAQAR
ncbi:MAG: tetratricopeptide repeat protein [Myxococcaceae bacterium]